MERGSRMRSGSSTKRRADRRSGSRSPTSRPERRDLAGDRARFPAQFHHHEPRGRHDRRDRRVGALRLIDADTGLVRQVAGTRSTRRSGTRIAAGAVRFTPDGRLRVRHRRGAAARGRPETAAVVATVSMPAESTNVSMAVVSDTRDHHDGRPSDIRPSTSPPAGSTGRSEFATGTPKIRARG